MSRFRLDPWLIAAALLPIIPLLTLLRPGIAGTADGVVHLLRTLQVVELMKSGVLYPQWAPDFYFGYGYPFFLFYAPGAHILGAVLVLLGLDLPRALVAVQVLALLLYSTGGYLAARGLFHGLARPRLVSMAALAAAAFYVFTPLRMRELFNQGNLSQLLALSLLPWCLWALIHTAREASLRRAIGAGALLAAMLYAHHPSAFLGYPILLLLGLAVAVAQAKPVRRPAVVAVIVAFVLALGFSAPFWVPWLLESRYGSLQRMETGPFNAALNLVPWDQLFAAVPLLDTASINSPRPLTVGLVQAILAGLGSLAALWLWKRSAAQKRPQAGTLVVVAALLALGIVLMLPVAAPIWTRLPLAKFIAFPWRLLGPVGLLAALVAATPLLLLPERPAALGLLLVLLLAPLSVAPYLFPPASLWAPVPEGGLTLADIGRYELAGGSRGTASANEYLPMWVADPDVPPVMQEDYEAGRTPERLDYTASPAGSRATTVSVTSLEDVYLLDLTAPAVVTIRRFYYPGWRAWLDGRPAEIIVGAPYGLITVDVPEGSHELRISFGTTLPRQIGWGLFVVALLASAWLIVRKKDRKRDRADAGEMHDAIGWGIWGIAIVWILALAGLKVLWVEPETQWFRIQSPVDSPWTMTHPLHLHFTNGVELLGYDLPRSTVRQGGELRVRLYWRPHEDLVEDLHSFVHLDAPAGAETWANRTKQQVGDMPSSQWPTGFYVVDDFRVPVGSDVPPVRVTVRVGLLDQAGQRIPLANGEDAAAIAQVEVAGQRSLRATSGIPSSDRPYTLGEGISLVGYQATLDSVTPDEREVELVLYWRTEHNTAVDYTVFAHLVSSTGELLGQKDGPACGGACLSTSWTPGSIIEDRRTIPVPAGIAADGLQVVVGLYDLETDGRLPVRSADGVEAPDRAIRVEVVTPTEQEQRP